MSRTFQRRRDKMVSTADKSRKFDEGLPIANKKQILGFFLVLFSVFLILSIVSYSDYDQSKLESFNLSDIFKSESKTSAYKTSNLLGIVGVILSGFFVKNTFGYFSIIIPFLLIIFGIQLLRKKYIADILQFSVYLLLLMVLFSTLFGMLKINLGTDRISYTLSGNSGDYFASILYYMIGSAGSYILIFGMILLFGFLMIDRSLVKSIARIKLLIESLKEKFRDSMEEIKEKRAEKKLTDEKRSTKDEIDEVFIKDTKINRPFENSMITEERVRQRKEIPLADEEIQNTDLTRRSEQDTYKETLVVEELKDYKLPGLDLLDEPLKEELEVIPDEELKENGRLLQAKLLHFDVKIEKVIATPGPVVTLYELIPAEDVKLSKIESLQDDIALAMKAKGIRMIIPIPGKGTVGVEIPNHESCIVKIKSVLGSKKFNDSNYQLPVALGKTISGEVYIDDLARMPHLLIAGSTGSGKSIGINTIITSLLYKLHPSDLKFILIDPKKIELNFYSKLEYHYLAVSKDINENIITVPQNAVLALKGLEIEMEKRYERLANAAVRNIYNYNKKFYDGFLKDDENVKHSKMPYLIVIIDELADLMLTASRDVEEPIARLAQLARAVGIHLVLATQRPSVDVITGVIKANFSARIAYLVNSKVDSRTILDMNGAEQLLGQGDMLYLPPGVPKPLRIQSPYISSEEVEKITDFISAQRGFSKPYELPSVNANKKKSYLESRERDELFEEAARLIVRYQQGSVSLLQRRLKVGYARAARIVDELESAGVVGPFDGSKAREVLIENEEQLNEILEISH